MSSPNNLPAQEALNDFLIAHISLENVAYGQGDDGTLAVQVPPVERDGALFTLRGRESVRQFYDLAQAAGGVMLDIHVDAVERDCTFTTFHTATIIELPRDMMLWRFLHHLGNTIASNTVIEDQQ